MERVLSRANFENMKYTIYNYYGGERMDEILYTDSLDKAIKLSVGAEHCDIVDTNGDVFEPKDKDLSLTNSK